MPFPLAEPASSRHAVPFHSRTNTCCTPPTEALHPMATRVPSEVTLKSACASAEPVIPPPSDCQAVPLNRRAKKSPVAPSNQTTVGPATVPTTRAWSASLEFDNPSASSESPSATQPPSPAFAVESNFAARMFDWPPSALNSVHATIGLPLVSITIDGRRDDAAVLLTPPRSALPASCSQPAPSECLATYTSKL